MTYNNIHYTGEFFTFRMPVKRSLEPLPFFIEEYTMKKKTEKSSTGYLRFFLFAVLLCVFSISACRMQPFSHVRVKASPSYKATLGARTWTISDYLNAKEVQKHLKKAGGSNTPQVYRYYRTGSNQERYLIQYSFDKKKLNIKNYKEKLTALDRKKKDFDNIAITIPNLTQEKSQSLDIDGMNDKILDALGSGGNGETSLDFGSQTGVLNPFPAADQSPVIITANCTGFKTVRFNAGGQMIITTSGVGAGFDYGIQDAQLVNNGQTVSGVIAGKKITFDIGNKDIKPHTELKIRFKNINAVPGAKIRTAVTFSGEIQRATGLNREIPQNLTAISIPALTADKFIEATIGKGSVDFTIDGMDGWSGCTKQKKITFAQSGGLNITPGAFSDFSTPIDLKDKKLNKSVITVTPVIKFVMTDATYTRPAALKLNVTVKPEELASVTLKYPDTAMSKKIDEALDSAITDNVSDITFEKVTAAVTVNGIPAGNTLPITLTSTALSLDETKNFTSNSATQTFTGAIDKKWTISSGSKFDMKAEIALPNTSGSGSSKTFTLNNIALNTAGETKKTLSGSITFTPQWKSITVKDTATKLSGNFDVLKNNGQVKDIFDKLGEYGIELHDMPLYICCNVSDLVHSSVNAALKLSAQTEHNSWPLVIPDSDISLKTNCALDASKLNTATREYRGKMPDGAFEISKRAKEDTSNPDKDKIKNTPIEVINQHPKNLSVSYEIKLKSYTVKKEDIDTAADEVEITPTVFIELPLGFTIKADKSIELFEQSDDLKEFKDRELFKRSETWDSDDKKRDFISFLRSAKLICDINNTTGLKGITVILDLKDEAGVKKITKKIMSIQESGSFVFEFTKEDRDIIMNNLLYPSITIKLTGGDYTMPRDAKLTLKMTARTDFDIDYTQTL